MKSKEITLEQALKNAKTNVTLSIFSIVASIIMHVSSLIGAFLLNERWLYVLMWAVSSLASMAFIVSFALTSMYKQDVRKYKIQLAMRRIENWVEEEQNND